MDGIKQQVTDIQIHEFFNSEGINCFQIHWYMYRKYKDIKKNNKTNWFVTADKNFPFVKEPLFKDTIR